MQKEREGGRDGGVGSGRDAADRWQRPSTSCVFFLVEQRKKVTKMNSATAPQCANDVCGVHLCHGDLLDTLYGFCLSYCRCSLVRELVGWLLFKQALLKQCWSEWDVAMAGSPAHSLTCS